MFDGNPVSACTHSRAVHRTYVHRMARTDLSHMSQHHVDRMARQQCVFSQPYTCRPLTAHSLHTTQSFDVDEYYGFSSFIFFRQLFLSSLKWCAQISAVVGMCYFLVHVFLFMSTSCISSSQFFSSSSSSSSSSSFRCRFALHTISAKSFTNDNNNNLFVLLSDSHKYVLVNIFFFRF